MHEDDVLTLVALQLVEIADVMSVVAADMRPDFKLTLSPVPSRGCPFAPNK